jgi:YD repeat-containing protein
LGTGVDGAVRRITTAYDSQGNPYLFTSYDAASGGNVVNQVKRVYNGLGQLTGEYQANDGAVDSSTPEVQYVYSAMAGGENNSRLVATVYPNGRTVDDLYNPGLDSAISRVSALADDSTGTILESYAYLGLDTIVERDHPETGVDLSYLEQPGDTQASTDGGDQYTGLDRFGRVIDQNWVNTTSPTPTPTSADRFQYAYDRDGNALYRADLVDAALSELYHANSAQPGDDGTAYDALGRLSGFARGVLSASGNNGTTLDTVSSPSQTQSFQLDALGNQTSVTTDGASQTRASNSQNQLTGVGSATLDYDASGNMTTDETGKDFVYDAWNRLVKVTDGTTGAMLAQYTYDTLGRRITEQEAGGPSAPAVSDAGFESPVVGSGGNTDYVYDPAGTPWTFSGGAGVTGNGTAFNWDNPSAPEGTQVGFLEWTGSFSQELDGWAAGTYAVSFDAAQRGHYQRGITGGHSSSRTRSGELGTLGDIV